MRGPSLLLVPTGGQGRGPAGAHRASSRRSESGSPDGQPAADRRVRAAVRRRPWRGGDSRVEMAIDSTSARHRIRHGIRHTAALAGRRPRPPVPNERLRHMLIGYARVSEADGSQSRHPAARRAAGRGRRRPPRLPRLRVRHPRRPPGARQLRACAPDGRRARRLEARPPRPHPRRLQDIESREAIPRAAVVTAR